MRFQDSSSFHCVWDPGRPSPGTWGSACAASQEARSIAEQQQREVELRRGTSMQGLQVADSFCLESKRVQVPNLCIYIYTHVDRRSGLELDQPIGLPAHHGPKAASGKTMEALLKSVLDRTWHFGVAFVRRCFPAVGVQVSDCQALLP